MMAPFPHSTMRLCLLLVCFGLQANLSQAQNDKNVVLTMTESECPNGKRNGDQWDEMKKDGFGFRKHCTTDENGGFCVKILGCISIKGTFIPRGQNKTEYYNEKCNLIAACIADGESTTYNQNYDCSPTRLPLTPKPATEPSTEKTAVTLLPPTGNPTSEDPIVTGRPVTLKPGQCEGGKKEGEEWDEQKNEKSAKFRKRCIVHPEDGYCIVIVGCYSMFGTLFERGTNITESRDNCDFVFACIAVGETGTKYQMNQFCGASTVVPRTGKPTPVTQLPPTGKTTKEDPIITRRPVTLKPGQCEGGKKEGEEWDEKKNEYSAKFRKRCIVHPDDGYCIIVVGCYSMFGELVERGKNQTVSKGKCDYVFACMAVGEKGTEYRMNEFCGASTLVPRTDKPLPPYTDKPANGTGGPSRPTEKPTPNPDTRVPVTGNPGTGKPSTDGGSSTGKPGTDGGSSTGRPDTDGVSSTRRPVTNPPGPACPRDKKEGETWDESNSHGIVFRKKCEDGCIIIIGCISQKKTFVKRGTNHSEIWNEGCDLITRCIANGTVTRVEEDYYCKGSTVITRMPSTGAPGNNSTGPTGPTRPTKPPVDPSGAPGTTDKSTDKPTDATESTPKTVRPSEPTDSPNNETVAPTKPTVTPTECDFGSSTKIVIPSEPTGASTNGTVTPSKPTEKPTPTTLTPSDPTEKPTPTVTPSKPTGTPNKTVTPFKPTEKSTPTTLTPSDPTDKPTPTPSKPTGTPNKTVTPSKPTEKSTPTTRTPSDPTDKPTPTPSKPTGTPNNKTVSPSEPTEKPTPTTLAPSDPTDKPTPTKATNYTGSPTPVTEPTPFTLKPDGTTRKPDDCKDGRKHGEEWDEKKNGAEFRKKCEDGCITITGCIAMTGTFVPRGENKTEQWNGRCILSECIAKGNTSTQYSWDFTECDGENTGKPTLSTKSPGSNSTESTKKPITDYTEKPGVGECPGGKKNGETWEDGRLVKKCTTTPDGGHCVKIIGCLSLKNGMHLQRGENHTEQFGNGCTRTTYCLDLGERTKVVDGDLVCPATKPPGTDTTKRPYNPPTKGPLVCANGKKVGETWIDDVYEKECTTDGEGMVCIKVKNCVTPGGYKMKRGSTYVETLRGRKVTYECIAEGDETYFLQKN